MRRFTPYRTPRINVDIAELDYGNAIDLAQWSPSLYEARLTTFLRMVVRHPDPIREGTVTDPRQWTVQERHAVQAHYIAHTYPEFDFQVGEKARFSQYLHQSVRTAEDVPLGPIAGDEWTLRPLLGMHAEAIERLILGRRIPGKQAGWISGALACQLVASDETEAGFLRDSKLPTDPLETLPDAQVDEWVFRRVEVFKRFAQSDLSDMLRAFLLGCEQQQHLVRINFNDQGPVLVSEVPGVGPARFPLSNLFEGIIARLLAVAD